MKIILITLVCIVQITTANAQRNIRFLIGQQAPNIDFQLSMDKKPAPDFYRKKFLILDFWATWCAPCIAAFPHLNALNEKFKSAKVMFASITDEPLATVQKFFTRTGKRFDPIRLIDTTKKTSTNFGVEFIPLCIIIAPDNTIRWAGQSRELTDSVLAAVIAGKKNEADTTKTITRLVNKPVAERSLFAFNAAKADSTKVNYEEGGLVYRFGSHIFYMSETNIALEQLLENITGYSKAARFSTNDPTKLNQKIDFFFRAGRDTLLFASYADRFLPGEPRKNIILSLLQETFRFRLTLRQQTVPVVEITVANQALLNSFASMQAEHKSFSDEFFPNFETVGYTLPEIAIQLENKMKRVIQFPGKMEGRWDLSLDITDLEKLKQTLSSHGLSVKTVNKQITSVSIDFY